MNPVRSNAEARYYYGNASFAIEFSLDNAFKSPDVENVEASRSASVAGGTAHDVVQGQRHLRRQGVVQSKNSA
jgi:hypothetical protein